MRPEISHQFERLPVADARRLFGLTGRALRYYEELGLVVAHRDSANARWYDAAGRRRLSWIARLRRFMPLHEIAEVLRAEEEEPAGGRPFALRRLDHRRVALEDELAALAGLTSELRR